MMLLMGDVLLQILINQETIMRAIKTRTLEPEYHYLKERMVETDKMIDTLKAENEELRG